MPPILPILIGIIAAAPQIVGVVQGVRDLAGKLFQGGVISSDDQAAVHRAADALQAQILVGIVPPELQVQADPLPGRPGALAATAAAHPAWVPVAR